LLITFIKNLQELSQILTKTAQSS